MTKVDNNLSIIIAGDFFVSKNFQGQDLIDKSMLSLFAKADYRIVNLEAPVTDVKAKNKILKTGPHLCTSEATTVPLLKQLKIDMVTLANNHILDYGENGLKDTFKVLKKEQIAFVGAGNNLKEAAKPYIIEKEGVKIAILNFAENEWANASEMSAGANPMDIIDNARQIKHAKLQADFVFVIVHGGHEYYNLPSPQMQKQYRFYTEQGADIVIGHHTHCVSGNEIYKGVPIYYSLGNFLFTMQSFYDDWFKGLVLKVEIKKGKLFAQLHPVKQQEKTFSFSLLKNEEKQDFLIRISSYNKIIVDESKLKHEWNLFIGSKYDSYLNLWSPLSFVSNRYIKGLLSRISVKGINKKGMASVLNLMRCEAHSDISKEVINRYLTK